MFDRQGCGEMAREIKSRFHTPNNARFAVRRLACRLGHGAEPIYIPR
jgi:hypothetical protein